MPFTPETDPSAAHFGITTVMALLTATALLFPLSTSVRILLGAATVALLAAACRAYRQIRNRRQTPATVATHPTIDPMETVLHRQNAYLKALHQTAVGMLRRLDLREVLESIIQQASELTGIPSGFLYIYDPEEDILEVKSACGSAKQFIGIRIHPGEGLSGVVFQKQAPMMIRDYSRWPGRLDNPDLNVVKAIVGIPIKSGGNVIGVIGLQDHEKSRRIDADTIVVLEQFSELAAIAIDNASLHETIKAELAQRKKWEREREGMEARLRQSQKMEAIGTLAGGIAHDFNNILAAVIGYSELSLADTSPDTAVHRRLLKIMKASERARDLVQQILSFSRQKEIDPRPIRVRNIVLETVNLLRPSLPAFIDIRSEIVADPVILGDPTQIHQILMNLCTNAAHAMHEKGGVLEVRLNETRITAGTKDRVNNLPEGRYLLLTVKDSGHGMSADVLERIFDPFFTTKPKGEGTGMGLSVVHGLVREHGGAVVVRSQPGGGAEFEVLIPVIEAQDAPDLPARRAAAPTGNERILLVDDEPFQIELGSEILGHLGYHVIACANGEDALHRFEAAPDDFDVVITDTTMPGLTGVRLARRLLEIRPDIPIILCTGYSDRIDETRAREIGVRRFVMKPVVMHDLACIIREVLSENRAADTP